VRLIGDIAERLSQFINRRIKAVLEVASSHSGPKALTKIVASYKLTGPGH
jgi:hypothetical protein